MGVLRPLTPPPRSLTLPPPPWQVQKLWHPLLYQQYQLKRAAMEKSCGHQQVERILYHGTTEQSSREICQFGFNRSFCGRNGEGPYGGGAGAAGGSAAGGPGASGLG